MNGLSAQQFGSQNMGTSDFPQGFVGGQAQTMSVPMGGMHGKIDYSVDLSQATKATPLPALLPGMNRAKTTAFYANRGGH